LRRCGDSFDDVIRYRRVNTVESALLMSGERRVITLVLLVTAVGCARENRPFTVSHIDRSTCASSFPVVADTEHVGTYPGEVKSGAGIFYDDVLEYRVWMHPERGARKIAGDADYFAAFACYENASQFSRANAAELPIVLVLQNESINEPEPGKFVWVRTARITEWKVDWLAGSRRRPESIPNFLATHSEDQKPSVR
jgi:hypothetical protein